MGSKTLFNINIKASGHSTFSITHLSFNPISVLLQKKVKIIIFLKKKTWLFTFDTLKKVFRIVKKSTKIGIFLGKAKLTTKPITILFKKNFKIISCKKKYHTSKARFLEVYLKMRKLEVLFIVFPLRLFSRKKVDQKIISPKQLNAFCSEHDILHFHYKKNGPLNN